MIEFGLFGFQKNDANEFVLVTATYAAYVVREPPASIMVIYMLNTKQVAALYYRSVTGGPVDEFTEEEVLRPFIPMIRPTLEAVPALWPALRERLHALKRPHAN